MENHVTNPNSNEYKLTAIVLDIADRRFFKPVGINKDEIDKCSFLKLSFANKGLDAINFVNFRHHKSVKYKMLPYFKDQSVLIISYAYTIPIATKLFDYNKVLHDLNIVSGSPFIYNSTGHVMNGDLKIINNTSVREVFAKEPKYREFNSINWKHNLSILFL